MNRQLLEQHFSPNQIKQRVGNFGQTLDYVEGWAVIQRLNEAFDGQWSFQVESHEILESEVIVLGKLTVEGGISKSQFGSSSVTKAKNTGEIISLSDDLKAASTDSLKKCATMLGVALHLYSGVTASTPKPSPIKNDPFANQDKKAIYCPPSIPGGGGNGGNGGTASGDHDHGNNGGNGNGGSRLSQKQHSFLLSLADNQKVSRRELDEMSKERFGCVASFLSRRDASSFIGEMTAS